MQDPNERIQRSLIKIAAWTFVLLVVLIGGSVFGYKSYRAWQERRLVAQANALVNEGNVKRASLDARRILQINPDSAAGCRIMARIAELGGAKTAIEWRRRVVELAPGNAEDLVALARTALRFQDQSTVDFAMKKMPEQAKTTADYHALAADLAAARSSDSATIEQHLREAVRVDPTNKENRMRLAALELAASDASVRAQGKRTLTELLNEPALRREAGRKLLGDALRRRDTDEALPLARQLDGFAEKTFSDRLLLLQALHLSADPGFTPLLQELQASAAQTPEDVAELISWLNMNQMPAAAISWASKLPTEIISQKAIPIALSDSYAAARDWDGLQRLVKAGNWGGVDFLRSALGTRAARELRNESEAAGHWNEAMQKISGNPKHALSLAEIVQRWGWRDQAIELLWLASKDPLKGDDALQALYTYFAKNGATHDLYRVMLRRKELRPDDLNVQNNAAQLGLLLNMNRDQAQRLARDLYEKQPKNAAYASTYAFALHSAGDAKKAVTVMGSLAPEQLRQPEIAAYYGIVLAGAGEHVRAAEFLDLGEKAGLLPEEKALLERARRMIAQR